MIAANSQAAHAYRNSPTIACRSSRYFCKRIIASNPKVKGNQPGKRQGWLLGCKAHASSFEASNPEPSEDNPSNNKRSAGTGLAASVPLGLPSPGAVFFIAGFLKLLIMCFPFTTLSVAMFIHGRADLGYWAVLKMLPLALGLAALAKFITDRKLQERREVRWALVSGSLVALLLSRFFIFSRGLNPNHPLAPMIRRRQQQQQAMLAYQAEVGRVNQLNRDRVLKSPADAQNFLKQRQQWQQQIQEAQQQAEQEEGEKK